MKKLLTIVFFEFTIISFLFSQNTDSSYYRDSFGYKLISEYYSGHNSIDFQAGYIANDFNELNSNFESLYGKRIGNRISCLGIKLKGELDIDAFFTCDANFSIE